MPKKRESFINKKNAVTYRLVPRSQVDPLKGDGEASPYVLVPVNESEAKKVNIKLPACALPTTVQGDEAQVKRIVQQKGPRPDWDPDIVAALDDDFNYDDSENILDDDFFTKAGCEVFDKRSGVESDADSDGFSFSDDDEFNAKQPKTGFTQYSLTSARTEITDLHKAFNDKFEKFCDAYEDDQIGPLDGEDIAGNLTSENQFVQDLIDDFQKHKKELYHLDNTLDLNMKDKILNLAEATDNEKLIKMVIELPLEYDCESIISTYSNKYNHPALIKADKKKLTKSHLKQLNRENKIDEEDLDSDGSEYTHSVMSASTFRPKNETPEQRRARKQAVKLIRRENRAIKKENKLAFKEEKKRQNAVAMNVRRNIGVRMF